MAVAKIVCGDCGAVISQSDDHCSQCGATIELPVFIPNSTRGQSKFQRCNVCGHENLNAGRYCESCGTELPISASTKGDFDSAQPEQGSKTLVSSPLGKKSSKKPTVHRASGKSKKKSPRKKFEPWQILSGSAVLMLIGFFIYGEASRDGPKSEAHVHDNIPAESAAMLQEIDRLEKVVESHPSDDASMLQLANLLHDKALRDRRLLFRAVDAYKRYLALSPENPDARVDLGICYFELARTDTMNTLRFISLAINEMETVHKANPKHQAAAFNLGIVNLSSGSMEKSNEWFKKALEIDHRSNLGQRAQSLLEQHTFP